MSDNDVRVAAALQPLTQVMIASCMLTWLCTVRRHDADPDGAAVTK